MNEGTQQQKQSEIREQLDLLDKALEEAEAIKENVFSRLESVMQATVQLAGTAKDANEIKLVPLADELRNLNERVFCLNSNYKNLLERLEL